MKNQLSPPAINFSGTEVSYTFVLGGITYSAWLTSGLDLVCRSTKIKNPPEGGIETIHLSQLIWQPGKDPTPGKYQLHVRVEGGQDDEPSQTSQEIDLALTETQFNELKAQIQISGINRTLRKFQEIINGLAASADVQKLQQRFTGLETAIAGAATKGQFEELAKKVTELEKLGTQIEALEKQVGDKASKQDVTDSEKRITDALTTGLGKVVEDVKGHKHDAPTPIPNDILNRLTALEAKTPPLVPTPAPPLPVPVPVPPQGVQPAQIMPVPAPIQSVPTKESWWQTSGVIALVFGFLAFIIGIVALCYNARGQSGQTPVAVIQPATPAPTPATPSASVADLESVRQAALAADRTNATEIAKLKTELINTRRGLEPQLNVDTNKFSNLAAPSVLAGGTNTINIITIGDGNYLRVGWPNGQFTNTSTVTNINKVIVRQPTPQASIRQYCPPTQDQPYSYSCDRRATGLTIRPVSVLPPHWMAGRMPGVEMFKVEGYEGFFYY